MHNAHHIQGGRYAGTKK